MDLRENKYLVGVRCVTYQHEKFIKDALDGFAMQQTDFPFLVMLIDDASTDGTQDVINRFLEDNFVLGEENFAWRTNTDDAVTTFARHKKNTNCHILSLNLKVNLWKNRAKKDSLLGDYLDSYKYLALCEGDDYWTDPLKLQKQVDFLESHPDFSMCFHRAKIKNECNANTSYARCEEIETKEYFANDMCPTWIVPTASVVYRYPIVSAYPLKHRDWFDSGDIVLFETCAHVGRVWGMEDAMSVYRMNAGSLLQNPQYLLGQVRKSVTHYRELKMNFPLLDADCMDELTGLSYYRLMKLTPNVFEKLKCLVFSIYYTPSYMWSKIIKLVRRK